MQSARVWIVRGGYLVTALAVTWVLLAFARHDGLDRLRDIGGEHLGPLGLLLIAYASISLLQGLAWWQLMLKSAGNAPAGLSVGIFALTQLGKYLPGNIMHFVFRYALTRAAGASRASVVAASGLEPWILLCAALALLSVLGGAEWPSRFDWPGWLAYVLPVLAVSALALAIPWLRTWLPGQGLRLHFLLPAFLLQAGFLLGSALLFMVLLPMFGPADPVPPTVILSASVLAWLAGFVMPGSPGGLGVREVVLSLSLATWADPAVAVGAAAAFRVLTLAGDLLVFAGGGVWWLVRGRRDLLSYRRFLEEAGQRSQPR